MKLQKIATAKQELEMTPTQQPGQDRHSRGCTTWCIHDCDDPGGLLPVLAGIYRSLYFENKEPVIASLGKKFVGKIFNILDPLDVY